MRPVECVPSGGMELRQLGYFEAVARHGGFTNAAKQLHVAQPAVSAQIQRLERELGASLFHRTTREVSLTPAGERLLAHVRRVLHELDVARAEVQDFAQVVRGRVRIGATPVVGSLPLPMLMATFRQAHPCVQMHLRTGLISDLLNDLDAANLDLVIGPKHEDDPRFSTIPVAQEGLVVITGPGPGGTSITRLRDVVDEPFVCLPEGSGLHSILTQLAEREGFTPRIEFETDSPASIRELVSAGIGVALIAESSATKPGPPVRTHHLKDPPEHPIICAMTSTRHPQMPATRIFYDFVAKQGNAF